MSSVRRYLCYSRRRLTVRKDPIKCDTENDSNNGFYKEKPLPARESMSAIKMREREG